LLGREGVISRLVTSLMALTKTVVSVTRALYSRHEAVASSLHV
jgi:hypothetical protein